MIGPAATGIYTACASILGFANPLLFGLFNILTPQCVRALRDEGVRGLRRKAFRATLSLAGLMGAFCLMVGLVGEHMLVLLYGAEYRGHGLLLLVLGLAAMAGALGAPASIALAAAERAGAGAAVITLTTLLNIVLVSMLLPAAGLFGATCGMLAAESIGGLARWIAFLWLVRPDAAHDARAGISTEEADSCSVRS